MIKSDKILWSMILLLLPLKIFASDLDYYHCTVNRSPNERTSHFGFFISLPSSKEESVTSEHSLRWLEAEAQVFLNGKIKFSVKEWANEIFIEGETSYLEKDQRKAHFTYHLKAVSKSKDEISYSFVCDLVR